MDLKIHPLANQFPYMSETEFAALKQDIDANGLQEPISLYEGKILDGRNRYRACEELELELTDDDVRELELSQEEAASYSLSQNLQRRHLSKSQQAMYLTKWEIQPGGETTEGGGRTYRTGRNAIRRVSERYGVSHVSIYKAMFVYENDRNLADRVLAGELSVAKAEKEIRGRDKEATSEVSSPAERVRELDREFLRFKKLLDKFEGVLPDGPHRNISEAICKIQRELRAVASPPSAQKRDL